MRVGRSLNLIKVVLAPARISRSLATVLVVTLIQTIGASIQFPHAVTSQAEAAESPIINTDLLFNAVGADFNGNGVALNGSPSFTAGPPAYYTFDSDAKYATKNIDYTDNHAASIFMWVYPTAAGIVLTINASTAQDSGHRSTMIDYTGSKFRFGLYDGVTGTVSVEANASTPVNNWYFIGFTYTGGTSRILTSYVNGVSTGSVVVTHGWDTPNPSITHFHFASQSASGAVVGTGTPSATTVIRSGGRYRLNQAIFYNSAQSSADVLSNFNSTQERFAPIASSPASTSTLTNRTASFATTCTHVLSSNGATTCAYQWQLSTDNGGNWSDISGATSSSYTTPLFNSVVTGYQYRVKVYDPGTGSPSNSSFFTYSTSASLTITQPPGSDTDTALSLNGTTQYASVADNSVFDIRDSISIEAWVNPSGIIASKWNFVVNKESAYQLGISTSGFWAYSFNGDANAAGISTGVPVRINEWHHIAITRLASTNEVKFYYDGYLAYVGTADGAGTGQISDASTAFSIGRRASDGRYFQGQIDHVALFDVVRSADNIKADMSGYISPSTSGLRAYYDFNEGSGSGSTLFNRKSGASSTSDLAISGSPNWLHVADISVTATSPYTVIKFPRTYITINGGWKVPANVSKASALVVAGGGGGGSRAAGGGGAGGLVYRSLMTLNPGAVETVTIGQGGFGGLSVTALTLHPGLNGQNSQLGSHTLAIGGGGGGGAGGSDNSERNGRDGGSGGGASGAYASGGSSAAHGIAMQITSTTYGFGNRGGSGVGGSYWNGGGGGGSGGAGSNSSTSSWVAGNGGAGTIDPVGMSNLCLAAGGGGGTVSGGSAAGSAGTCTSGTITAGAGSIGSEIAGSALANSGSGGGGSGYSNNADVGGGNGGSGVIIIRWITALTPTYTKPTNVYLNVGMTETFTTNVSQDSATVILTRTFKWESTTPAANGAFTLIKQGTGSANAAFSWVPSDTTTSGSGYLYRLTVTDSDTAGLFISDSSTAYAIINRALVVSGISTFGKKINVSRSETFTITLGTSTYRPTLSPVIAGISLDTSTAGIAVVKISETITVGTYYETLTVIDSVSASVVTPLTIVVSAPPTLLNTDEIISSDLLFHLDAGNSQSIILEDGASTAGFSWNDLSGRKSNAATGAGVDTGAYGGTACVAPTYSANNGGAIVFAKNSDSCYYTNYTGSELEKSYTFEAWFKTSDAIPGYSAIFSQAYPSTGGNLYAAIGSTGGSTLVVGFWDGGTWRYANCPYTPTVGAWTHMAGTYDGTTMYTYINGSNTVNGSACASSYSNGYTGAANSKGIIIGKGHVGSSSYTFPGSIASVRIYKKPLTSAQILQNYNATKYRFLSSNIDMIYPSHKYGNTTTETFTATSGYGSDSYTFAVGNKAGVKLETTTSVVTLKMQESLTATTHFETITVTDSLGQSTYLPIKMTVSKADTLTISMDTKTVVTFNNAPITSYPKPVIKGLAGLDTFTVTTKFSSALYSKSSTVPTNSDTYTIVAEDPVFGIGALSNYVNVVYETSTAVVNKAKQPALSVFLYGGTVGQGFPITVSGGGGDGAISETVTAGSTMTGCSISNHVLTATSTSQGFCRVYIVKALSQNYLSESITVDMYFMAYINNQPTGLVGSGSTIALNGATSLTIADTSTVRAPNVTSLSTTSGAVGSVIHIYGGNFGAGPVTVKFNRNKYAIGTVISGNDITVTVPTGALTGTILVIAAGGEAYTPTFTVTP